MKFPQSIGELLIAAKKDVFAHLAVDLFVGIGLMVGSPHRTKGPAFEPAKLLLHTPFYPMRAAGAILVVMSLVMIISLIIGSQHLYDESKWLLQVYWGFWAGVFAVSFFNGESSPFSVAFSIAWAYRTVRLPVDNPLKRVSIARDITTTVGN
jgi:hypothetical protein